MYELTLTKGEREAFDWVGGRYSNGDAMSDILGGCLGEDEAWDDDGVLTFRVPEHKAWEIAELAAEGDSNWPCFSDELARTMQAFCDRIV